MSSKKPSKPERVFVWYRISPKSKAHRDWMTREQYETLKELVGEGNCKIVEE